MRFSARIVAILALAASPATAIDLDFDRNLACGAVICAPGDLISQDYGDQADLDIAYVARAGPGNTTALPAGVRYWDSGYSNFNDVAFAGDDSDAVIEITFTPRNGAEFQLYWAYLGGVQANNPLASLRLYDLAYATLFDYRAGNVGPLGVAYGFSGIGTYSGFILQIGPNGHDVGVDRLTYLVNSVQPAVPEPATWAMLVAGFGLIGAALRRRPAAAAR